MSSFQYKLTEFLFRHTVRPMMKRAAMYPEKFIEKRRKTEQKKRLPLPSLHKKYDFDEQSVGDTPYYTIHSRYKSGERLVLYFFGGGFVMSGDSGDFEFAQEMADRTGADVWLVWHKLLPEVTDKEVIESVITVYRRVVRYASTYASISTNKRKQYLCRASLFPYRLRYRCHRRKNSLRQ